LPTVEWNRATWTRDVAKLAEDVAANEYGKHWGDPLKNEYGLRRVYEKFIIPYVDPKHTALEIGPGGGRWTQFLTGFKKLYVVDINDVFFPMLKKRFPDAPIEFVLGNGADFPSIRPRSIDFVFSFGVFVHVDAHIVLDYLMNLKPLLVPDATAVIQYPDKTKPLAIRTPSFAGNSPALMRVLVEHAGYRVIEEDLGFAKAAIVRFAPR
jgi:hypothetical protein